MTDDSSPRGRSRWSRTVDDRFVPAPAPPTQERQATEATGPSGGSEAILLVEDEAEVRDAASVTLERLGYRVDAVRSADEALRWLGDGGRLDLLIADVVLPGMNGVALAARVTAERAGIRVLFVSGYTSEQSLPADTLRGELHAFLEKPFRGDTLARAVRALLDRAR